ncbi:MAG: glycosyltransferase family 2 protein [Anaerolineae bacterium]|nr:glycosyltransferase family 2 protein [Anaerolineae bacterium]
MKKPRLQTEFKKSAPGSSTSAPHLTVVIPAYNEADALAEFLPRVAAACGEHNWRLVVVDDGSTDRSMAVLMQIHAQHRQLEVISHKVNRGYGAALKSGLAHVTTSYAITIDADGQHRIEDIQRLLTALQRTNADLVIGSRSQEATKDGYRRLGKAIIRGLARLLITLNIQDLNSGMKLYRTELVKRYLHLCPNSMAFSDVITLLFVHQRHRVVEEPISINPRQTGSSTISTLTAVDTVLEIMHIVMLLDPQRIFLPAAMVCFAFGLVWGLPIVLMGRGVSVGAMLAIVTGLVLLALGLLAEQLALIRRQTSLTALDYQVTLAPGSEESNSANPSEISAITADTCGDID